MGDFLLGFDRKLQILHRTSLFFWLILHGLDLNRIQDLMFKVWNHVTSPNKGGQDLGNPFMKLAGVAGGGGGGA